MGILYDITRPLNTTLAPWPGDTPFHYHLAWDMDAGAPVNVGAVTMSTHFGTHTDAPFHYLPGGAPVDALDPARYVGPALVVDVTGAGPLITREHLGGGGNDDGTGRHPLDGVTRLLLKTGAWPDPARFPTCLPVLAADVPAWLGARGVRLLGLDVPSVDPVESKDLPIHHALAAADVLILESLDLSAVPPGAYELIALPLRLVGGDASPVRAVLRAA